MFFADKWCQFCVETLFVVVSSNWEQFRFSKSNSYPDNWNPLERGEFLLSIFTDISLRSRPKKKKKNVPAAAASYNSTMSQPRSANSILTSLCHLARLLRGDYSVFAIFYYRSETDRKPIKGLPLSSLPRAVILHFPSAVPTATTVRHSTALRAALLLCLVVVVEIHRTRSGERPPNLDADWPA